MGPHPPIVLRDERRELLEPGDRGLSGEKDTQTCGSSSEDGICLISHTFQCCPLTGAGAFGGGVQPVTATLQGQHHLRSPGPAPSDRTALAASGHTPGEASGSRSPLRWVTQVGAQAQSWEEGAEGVWSREWETPSAGVGGEEDTQSCGWRRGHLRGGPR